MPLATKHEFGLPKLTTPPTKLTKPALSQRFSNYPTGKKLRKAFRDSNERGNTTLRPKKHVLFRASPARHLPGYNEPGS
jgi:hypothetical protein